METGSNGMFLKINIKMNEKTKLLGLNNQSSIQEIYHLKYLNLMICFVS